MKDNLYIKSIAGLMLFSAVVHMLVLITFTLIKGDVFYLNFFNILNLDLISPGIGKGALSQIISFLFMVLIYLAIYFYLKKKEK